MKTYESGNIAVSFDVKRCIHARRCVLNLPAVFQAAAKGDWIIPGNASAAVRNGVLDIQPAKDGPLVITGSLETIAGSGRRVSTDTTTVLCRCGASKNKPFCDGCHHAIDFKAD